MEPWHKRIWNWFGSDADTPGDAGPAVTAKVLVEGALSTRPDELSCDECYRQLDHFVEMKISGENPAEIMPLVQDHLDRCPDCNEEYEALLLALQANG